MSLVTRCPKCQSGFEVTADQLRLHDGLVRCGQCAHVFDGYAHLQASLPTLTRKVEATDQSADDHSNETPNPGSSANLGAPSTAVVAPDAEPLRPSSLLAQRIRISAGSNEPTSSEPEIGLTRIVPTPRSTTVGREQVRIQQEPALSIRPTPRLSARTTESDQSAAPVRVMGEARIRGEDPSSPGRREPEFMEDLPEQGRHAPTIVWLGLALILLVTLVLQVALYFRNEIATAMPMSRGVLEQVCQRLGCEVSYVRRPDRIVIIGSSLQQSEQSAAQKAAQSIPYILRLTLQNRNDAAQPWPSLLLTLNDASGTVVIRKVLDPDQYLPPSMVNQPFAARQEVAFELPIVVEGHVVSGFEVRRFFP